MQMKISEERFLQLIEMELVAKVLGGWVLRGMRMEIQAMGEYGSKITGEGDAPFDLSGVTKRLNAAAAKIDASCWVSWSTSHNRLTLYTKHGGEIHETSI